MCSLEGCSWKAAPEGYPPASGVCRAWWMDIAPMEQASPLFPRKETSRHSGGPSRRCNVRDAGKPGCLSGWPYVWIHGKPLSRPHGGCQVGLSSHSGEGEQTHALCMGLWEELSIEELVRKTGSEARDNSPPIPQVESSSQDLPNSRGLLTSPTSGCFKQTAILLFL